MLSLIRTLDSYTKVQKNFTTCKTTSTDFEKITVE